MLQVVLSPDGRPWRRRVRIFVDEYIHVGVRYAVGVDAVPVPRKDVQQVVRVEVKPSAVSLLSPRR